MGDLGNPKYIQQLIQENHFAVQKKYGQNFLVDSNILDGIVRAAEITKDDTVLEIGPGMGSLTQHLLEAAGRVIAVEVDKMLIPILQENLKGYDNLTLIHGDILKDIDALIYGEKTDGEETSVANGGKGDGDSEFFSEQAGESGADEGRVPGKKVKVVANLPYYITTPIVMELLEKQENIESITVMVQKEVALRMQEGPGSKSYGALSLAVQYYSKPEIAMTVSKHCFLPKPDVDSAVIKLDIYAPEERPVKAKDPEFLFKVIRAAFNQRRKTLVNALANDAALKMPKEKTAQALAAIGKPETTRGEALTLSEFAELADELL